MPDYTLTMSNDENFDIRESIFKRTFKRFRDILIPYTAFRTMVQYVENAPAFEMACLQGENIETATPIDINNTWCMPYPYVYPATDIKTAMSKCNTREEMNQVGQECSKRIAERAFSFIRASMSTEVLDAIDNDPDVGGILHVATGHIVLFHYSCVSDLQVVQVHSNIVDMVHLAEMEEVVQQPNYTMNRLYNLGKFILSYSFTYTKPDPYNPSGELVPCTIDNRTAMDQETAAAISSNVIQQFKEKRKVILTT